MIQFYKKINFFGLLILLTFLVSKPTFADEKLDAIIDQIQSLSSDLKTLEKAVYQNSNITSLNSNSGNEVNEDAVTRHLIKLNQIEDQFRNLTNQFEEINFKLDKLSSRVTKIQSDTQLRFYDLEQSGAETSSTTQNKKTPTEKVKLPGAEKPQDFGAAEGYDMSKDQGTQATQSIDAAQTVVVNEPERKSLLPQDKSPDEQYSYAIGLIKVGDYDTAEFALREFIDNNKDHNLAGHAQFWYGETFRIRQLYSDAAAAYLDGYQNYPKSDKAPDNLLKLGVTMVELGEKDQGCSMITNLKKEYPKASKSVLQKAQYEEKRFKCPNA
jgi:tol-pal system protein YbgF